MSECHTAKRPASVSRGNKSPVRRRYFIWFPIIASIATACSFLFFSEHTTAQESSSCIACHSTLEARQSDPVRAFEHDIHKARGLSCNDCHGGDPSKSDKAAAKDRMQGYIGKPTAQQLPGFCGKCHSDAQVMKKFNPSLRVDQVQEYFTSVHGRRLQAGDQKVATCVSCHGVHGIRSPGDPQSSVYPLNIAETCSKCHASGEYMAEYGIAHDQYDKYRSSVHARALYEKHDLSAPSCNDCHGNHGAVPPGLTSVANVCGQCHARQAELFRASPHKAPFEANQLGECVRCHSNHGIVPPNDQMAGVGELSACTSCHQGDKGFAGAQKIGEGLQNLSDSIDKAEQRLKLAERAGMEVSKPTFELEEASDALTQARVLVHTASVEEVETALAPGLNIAEKSFLAAESAFAELAYRRKGLVVSLFFILFLAALVYLKVRQIEGKYPFADSAPG